MYRDDKTTRSKLIEEGRNVSACTCFEVEATAGLKNEGHKFLPDDQRRQQRERLNWVIESKNIIFFDESTIQIGTDQKTFIIGYYSPDTNRSQALIMVWAEVSYTGYTNLCIF